LLSVERVQPARNLGPGADPGEPETRSQRADEMLERLHTLQEDRKRILRRLTKVDPAFSAPMN
jgi:hypothetical protein